MPTEGHSTSWDALQLTNMRKKNLVIYDLAVYDTIYCLSVRQMHQGHVKPGSRYPWAILLSHKVIAFVVIPLSC